MTTDAPVAPPKAGGAPPKGRTIQWESIKLPAWLTGLIGGVAIIILWWMVATLYVTSTGAHPIPTPLEVVQSYLDSGWEYYWRNFSVTLTEAGIGYLWGNGIALLLAALVLVIPRLEGVATQLAIITYCIPIVAVGMLAIVVIPAPKVGEPSGTAVLLAALSVFFTTVVGALLGLEVRRQVQPRPDRRLRRQPLHPARQGAPDRGAAGDSQRAADRGSGRLPRRGARRVLRKDRGRRRHRDDPRPAELQRPARLGARSRERRRRPARVRAGRTGRPWHRTLVEGKELMTTLTAAHELQRTAPPEADLSRDIRRAAKRNVLRALGWSVVTFVGTLVAALALWVGVLWIFQISPLIAKGPVDVWNYFFTVPNAAANRELIMGNLAVTLGHAFIGFIAGLVAAILAAALFQLSKGAEHALMPIAMLLRSVPADRDGARDHHDLRSRPRDRRRDRRHRRAVPGTREHLIRAQVRHARR